MNFREVYTWRSHLQIACWTIEVKLYDVQLNAFEIISGLQIPEAILVTFTSWWVAHCLRWNYPSKSTRVIPTAIDHYIAKQNCTLYLILKTGKHL